MGSTTKSNRLVKFVVCLDKQLNQIVWYCLFRVWFGHMPFTEKLVASSCAIMTATNPWSSTIDLQNTKDAYLSFCWEWASWSRFIPLREYIKTRPIRRSEEKSPSFTIKSWEYAWNMCYCKKKRKMKFLWKVLFYIHVI